MVLFRLVALSTFGSTLGLTLGPIFGTIIDYESDVDSDVYFAITSLKTTISMGSCP